MQYQIPQSADKRCHAYGNKDKLVSPITSKTTYKVFYLLFQSVGRVVRLNLLIIFYYSVHQIGKLPFYRVSNLVTLKLHMAYFIYIFNVQDG